MLAKSSKSRFAAIAIMALGVSTFMGTSAALATGVTVSGTVGACETASTVTAAAVDFGTVAKGTIGTKTLTPTITNGKKADCTGRNSVVTPTLGSFSANASATTDGDKVVIAIGDVVGENFPMTANVPTSAATGSFGATVTFTLSDND